MLLNSSAAFSLSASALFINARKNAYSSTVLQFPSRNENVSGGKIVIKATKDSPPASTSGEGFNAFGKDNTAHLHFPTSPRDSIARQKFTGECERAINEQINVAYTISYAYRALYTYFDRDHIALKGLAKFFKELSTKQREHAEKLMEYQNKRGGEVTLRLIEEQPSDFKNAEKGDALNAMENALILEKLATQNLLRLHQVAVGHQDTHLAYFVESEFLTKQVESVRKAAEYVSQLRRLDKGHGLWHFDQMLLHHGAAAC